MRSKRLAIEQLELRRMLQAGPLLITEFMAGNDHTLADADGDFPDWIEIHNPGPATVNLDGWHLSDDRSDLTQWQFPAIELEANDYLTVFASNKDRRVAEAELHTNFKLTTDGEYLALVEPDGTTVACEFAPKFPRQFTDVSYGLGQEVATFVAEGDRATYHVPTPGDDPLPATWTAVGFNDSTWTGTGSTVTGVGFQGGFHLLESFDAPVASLPGGVYPQWSMHSDGSDTASVAGGILHLESGGGVSNTRAVVGDVPAGEFRVNAHVGAQSGGTGGFNVGVVIGNATVVFHPGYDGGAFRYGRTDGSSITSNQGMGFTPPLGVPHEFEVTVTPNGGAWNLSVTIVDATNAANVFTDTQTLSAADVGATVGQIGFSRCGGGGGDGIYDNLVISGDGGGSFDPRLIATDVESSMLGISASLYLRQTFQVESLDGWEELTLRMKYDDGFVAYLNGTEIARRNAPPTVAHANAEVGLFEEIDVSDRLNLLQLGDNVLAIHGLNLSAGDDDFLVLAELVAGSAPQSCLLYFLEPTPGAVNREGFGEVVVEGVAFSRPGGTFDGAFLLQLTAAAPDARIHYTLDGSPPTQASPVYAAAIPIDTTTQVRAALIKESAAPGPIRSESYIRLAADVAAFTSPLPLLVIENFGAGGIPNKGWNQTGTGIVQVPRQAAQMVLFDHVDGARTLLDVSALDTRIGIRVRGAFSSSFEHPGYSVEAWDEYDAEQEISPLGMPEESDWVLYAPNRDHDVTLLDNTFIYELSNQVGHYAARTRFVEAFINEDGGALSMDDHVGVYVLVEKVKRDKNRIDFAPLSADGSEGGWMIDINRIAAQPVGGGTPQYFHTAGPNRIQQTPPNQPGQGDDIPRQYNAFFNFASPDGYEINAQQRAAIENWFQEFEDALYGADFADPEIGYAKYLDADDFIDYFILHNLTKNGDGLLLSMWAYKDGPDGKLKMGPPWDYDLGAYTEDPTSSLKMHADRLWYGRLFQDPNFNQRYQDRWQELRRGPMATENLHAIVDAQAAEITGEVATRHGVSNWPGKLDTLKSWLQSRAEAIDAQWLLPPEFSHAGGRVDPGFELTVTAPGGDVYYTTDGSDPRLFVSPIYTTFVAAGDAKRVLVPTVANRGDLLGTTWLGGNEPFDDLLWIGGGGGVGYDENTTYNAHIGADLDLEGPMNDVNTSAFVRIPFTATAEQLADVPSLTLKMQYDDGFIAYLNGVQIESANPPPSPAWDSQASDSHDDSKAVVFENLDVSKHAGELRVGKNVLAIHGLNRGITSSDFLINAQLVTGEGTPGGVSPTAVLYTGPVTIDDSAEVTARVLDGNDWSGPREATFSVFLPAAASNLVVTELNYDPHVATAAEVAMGATDKSGFEFVELQNVGSQTIDLTSVQFTDGVEFDFTGSNVTTMAPGEFVVVVKDSAAFEARYGTTVNVAGSFDLSLESSGERLTLLDWAGATIADFRYDNNSGWPGRADGKGATLELVDPTALPADAADRTAFLNDPDNWQSSVAYGGTPGGDSQPHQGVVVNEVLSHTDWPQVDSIELHNVTDQPIDVGGWYLSDRWGWDPLVVDGGNDSYKKFRIPDGTSIPSHGYVVFDERDFNPTPLSPAPNHFALDGARGDDVWLMR
ncbi:MAG: CotH kinase family protein, partial [Candidatus Nealsonbacteria bacterium]|nr:CotH kinase family protein [Candidatus Nealsonbacteria bacterium]